MGDYCLATGNLVGKLLNKGIECLAGWRKAVIGNWKRYKSKPHPFTVVPLSIQAQVFCLSRLQ